MARNYDNSGIENSRREYLRKLKDNQLNCDHMDNNGSLLEPVKTTSLYVQNKNQYSDTCVICKRCRDIIDMTAYTQNELRQDIFMLKSAANQIKVFDKCSDEDYAKLTDICAFLDELENSFTPYYGKVMNKLSGKGNGKQKSQGRQKGRLGGLSSNQFATR